MSEKINDGGSAFPVMHQHTQDGLSMRDYFAAKAMQGFCADPTKTDMHEFAEAAYSIADSMLKAREVKS